MMQDTILSLCKDSVKEFVNFMVKFIPRETKIISTSQVNNTFEKNIILDEDEQIDDEDIPDSELTTIQLVRREMNKMFDKNKDPEPLFVLDLILKPNQLIPQYSTDPKDIVTKIMEVFDEGIECLQ